MNNQDIQLTSEGLQTLKEELRVLVEEKRPKLVDRLSYARTQGDLAENSDYHSAKEELEFMDGRIGELEHVIKKAKVITPTGTGISVGTKVKLKVNGGEISYHIVGEWEADPTEKKISHTSPLGLALAGKNIGDTVEVDAPAGKVTYEILSIE
jgi:transcription elongation factor GreA